MSDCWEPEANMVEADRVSVRVVCDNTRCWWTALDAICLRRPERPQRFSMGTYCWDKSGTWENWWSAQKAVERGKRLPALLSVRSRSLSTQQQFPTRTACLLQSCTFKAQHIRHFLLPCEEPLFSPYHMISF